ncbi:MULTISPECIES: hypothetical protein [unclassified Endozoicomonas]|uniref:hypothetical protein n=1 Tax=unclassified Endozoicomonas TaxID=2644528 RepID=UPI003BB61A7E
MSEFGFLGERIEFYLGAEWDEEPVTEEEMKTEFEYINELEDWIEEAIKYGRTNGYGYDFTETEYMVRKDRYEKLFPVTKKAWRDRVIKGKEEGVDILDFPKWHENMIKKVRQRQHRDTRTNTMIAIKKRLEGR